MALFRVMFLLLCFSSIAFADVRISLPLQGWHRSGQYVPVCLRTDGSGGEFSLSAVGAVDTTIHLDGGRRTLIVPWLILQAPEHDSAVPDIGWRAVSPTQRLVGLIGSGSAHLQPLFPGQQIIPLPLDESIALDGNAVCWQTLSAVVMDVGRYERLGKSKIESLLAVGLMLAVVAPADTAIGPEFQFRDGFWVAHRPVYGPQGAAMGEEAYLPAYGWKADWPVAIRRQLFLSAAVLVLGLLSLSRLKWRWNWLVLVILALAVTGGLAVFAWRHPPIFPMQADLLIRVSTLAQRDTWSYQTARQTNAGGLRWTGPTWPALFKLNQISQTRLTLRCGPDGLPRAFTYTLNPNSTLAFRTRQFFGAEPVATTDSTQLPMLPLARRLYPALTPIGQIPSSDPNHWPTLVLQPR